MKDERMFPIQAAPRGYAGAAAPLSVPWSVAEKAYGVYASRYGRSQSLDRMAERGGFGVTEMDDLYPAWREEVSEITHLRAALAETERERDEVKASLLQMAEGVSREFQFPRNASSTPTCTACEVEGATIGSRPKEEHDPSADCRYAPPAPTPTEPDPLTSWDGRCRTCRFHKHDKREKTGSTQGETDWNYEIGQCCVSSPFQAKSDFDSCPRWEAPPAPTPTEPYQPSGVRFYDAASDREMLLEQNPGSPTDGWILFRHPDGQWVTLRKATPDDLVRLAAAPVRQGHGTGPCGEHGHSFTDCNERFLAEQAEGHGTGPEEEYLDLWDQQAMTAEAQPRGPFGATWPHIVRILIRALRASRERRGGTL